MQCKRCGEISSVKSGFVRGVQRYKCKGGGAHFVEGDRRMRYDGRTRLQAIRFYLEGVGFRGIERLLKINNVTAALDRQGRRGSQARRFGAAASGTGANGVRRDR